MFVMFCYVTPPSRSPVAVAGCTHGFARSFSTVMAAVAASSSTPSRADLPPPSPEFSQAKTLESFRAGKLGGLTLRSEGKRLKPSDSFSLTLEVEEPSVLAFRWSSVTDGPLHFNASIKVDGQESAMLAPLEARTMHRSGALDVGVGTCTFTWDNRSPLFERAVSYCVMLCPNRELCEEQRAQAAAQAAEVQAEAEAQADLLRQEAAAVQAVADEARTNGMGQQAQAAEVHEEIERLLVLVRDLGLARPPPPPSLLRPAWPPAKWPSVSLRPHPRPRRRRRWTSCATRRSSCSAPLPRTCRRRTSRRRGPRRCASRRASWWRRPPPG